MESGPEPAQTPRAEEEELISEETVREEPTSGPGPAPESEEEEEEEERPGSG
jgi:hypothetical protein